MATLPTKSDTPLYEISVNGVDLTTEYSQFIESISIDYGVSTPANLQIQLSSNCFIETFFDAGSIVNVKFGWDRLAMIDMITAKIISPPDGSMSDVLSMSIKAIDNKSLDMSKSAKNRTFKVNTKPAVVAMVASNFGLIPYIDIDDNLSLSQRYVPIQKNKTDMQFLQEQALRWDCLCWIDGNTLYFVDSEKAHSSNYNLDFRINTNNVSNISWKKKTTKGKGSDGSSAGAKGGDEVVTKPQAPEDFAIEALGQYWKVSPETLRKTKENPNLWLKITMLAATTEANKQLSVLKEYFVPVTHGQKTRRTNKHKSNVSSYLSGGWDLDISLNIGDPALRPPRKAVLESGNLYDEESKSYLPSWITEHGKIFNINKVTHSLSSGMLQTKLKLSDVLK